MRIQEQTMNAMATGLGVDESQVEAYSNRIYVTAPCLVADKW
jgi:hypothetical protein